MKTIVLNPAWKNAVYEYELFTSSGTKVEAPFPQVRGNEIKDGKIVPIAPYVY